MDFLAPIPLARTLPLPHRRILLGALGLMAVTITVLTIATVDGDNHTAVGDWLRTWGTSACYMIAAGIVCWRAIIIKEGRGPWMVIAIGVSLYGLGNVVWEVWLSNLDDPPIPSLADALWLALYPAAYVGILWLIREELRRVNLSLCVDGVIAGLGLAAIGAAIVFPPVLDAATGSTQAVMTNLAYPIGDLILSALVVGVFAVRGWRLDRLWVCIGAGFITLTLADSIYLLRIASGAFESSNVANIFFLVSVALIAFAAWQPDPAADRPKVESWGILILPTLFVGAAILLLAFEQSYDLGPLGRTLALLTIVAGFGRAILSFRDLRTLGATRMLSLTDDLTSLPNRRLFLQRLRGAVTEADAIGNSCALLLLDLDQFKELNDTLGHAAGDDLLRQIGPRLRSAVRTSDTLARLGGDEFGIVIPTPVTAESALAIANKLRGALAAPFTVQDVSLHVDASIGISMFPVHGGSADELLRLADVALYQAKRARCGSTLYDPARDTHSRRQLSLASELKEGLARDEITVEFQPKSRANDGRIVGMEALARWRHPAHGMVPPATFVPVAEQAGLSRALTTRVLDLALAQCSEWHAAGHQLHVSINATVADLVDLDFPDQIAAALAEYGLPAGALVIEITEVSILSDPARIEKILARLKTVGVMLSLDDFGTGYSSLTHLRSLPVDEVKIDRSFVSNLADDTKDLAIVLATIRLAETLSIGVVAEGVEDQRTWAKLADAGCDLIQGYGVSRPVPAAQATQLLSAPIWARSGPGEPKPVYSREKIAETALAIADAEGHNSVSMRRVATELRYGTMTLHHYVRSKDELLALMADTIMGELVISDDDLPDGWRDAMAEMARSTRLVAQRHPWILERVSEGTPYKIGPGLLRWIEQTLAVAARTGLSVEKQHELIAIVDDYVIGYAMRAFDTAQFGPERGQESRLDGTSEYVADEFATGDYPYLAAAVSGDVITGLEQIEHLTSSEQRFERGLQRVLDGLELWVHEVTGAKSPAGAYQSNGASTE